MAPQTAVPRVVAVADEKEVMREQLEYLMDRTGHEGFCVPLLEAFHFGVPVIARPDGAVPETVGDAALLVDDSDPAVVAELLDLAVRDESLRASLRGRGKARLKVYSPDVVAGRLRAAVEETLAAAARR